VRRGNIVRSGGGYLRRAVPERTERDKPLGEFDHGDK
jgi:hypothetical protein